MAMLQERTLSNRTVAALTVERDTVFWDRELTGFGIRIYPTGGKVYVAQARGPDGPKRMTVGRHGVIGAEQARRRAALVIARVKAGEEPVPLPLAAKLAGSPTVADLAARYLEEHVAVRCKPSTANNVRTAIHLHIMPTLGKLPLAAVERAQVADLHRQLSASPASANKFIKILSHMYRLAEGWGIVEDGGNPCRSVKKYPERKRERFLTNTEFARLGRVLDEAATQSGVPAQAVAAIRLLMLTGCRKTEILTLRWEEIDLDAGEIRLVDAKTGARVVQLPSTAVRLLEALPRRAGSSWVLPGNRPETHMSGIDTAWRTVRARAGLDDLRIHDLRHSFASRALALGETLPVIGKLLGHSDLETTARYAHLARESIHEAAERIAGSISADIL